MEVEVEVEVEVEEGGWGGRTAASSATSRDANIVVPIARRLHMAKVRARDETSGGIAGKTVSKSGKMGGKFVVERTHPREAETKRENGVWRAQSPQMLHRYLTFGHYYIYRAYS